MHINTDKTGTVLSILTVIFFMIMGMVKTTDIAVDVIHKWASTDEATPEVEVGRDAFTFDNLLDAIEGVESNHNANAVGDNGNAVGSFQIWKIYVDDVNRILRLQGEEKTYFYRARQVRSSSREMVTIYLKHYGRESRIGREVTCVDMAAMHCAGPDGYRQMDEPKVKNYVKKVMDRLDKREK